ncbi:MAG: glycosyltransferase [Anaerolineae bacterium]|nr:glycosyltransferase [Anaerolineae bacterium]
MNLLFLTPQLPYPPQHGGALRAYNLIRVLAQRHQITLLSFVRSPADLDRAGPLHHCCRRIEIVPAPLRSRWQRALSVLLSPEPDLALRLVSAEFQGRLETLLREDHFDVIQIEEIMLARYGPALGTNVSPRPRLVFDTYNAEYVLQQRAFETDVRDPRRWVGALYSLIQWRKLRSYEARICRYFDCTVVVSEADAAALRALDPNLPLAVVPNGVDVAHYADYLPSTDDPVLPPNSLVFTGKMDFRPNVDAVLWFVDSVLPLVRQQVPDVRFYIVGQSPLPRVQALATNPDVVVTGRVPDVRPYIAGAAVYVVPLRIGGGSRLKILEALAMGRAVVSTSLGCEGYPLTAGRELVIADEPEEFARAVVQLLRDPARRAELGRAGQRFTAERYDWGAIVSFLERVYLRQVTVTSQVTVT